MTYDYGRSPTDAAYQRRKYIHEHIVASRAVPDALPTIVRAVYYVGVGTKAWPSDAEAKAAGKSRVPSQDVSDDTQWLIDRGLVDEDEVIDVSGHLDSYCGTADVLVSTLLHAKGIILDPWSPEPVPVLIAEGENDLALINPIGKDRRIQWCALGGMVKRGHMRRLLRSIEPWQPIGYVGDWNRSGSDIERNAERFLRANGWSGAWERIMITDSQAVGLPQILKTDGRDGKKAPSVETAAMPVAVARGLINDWLDARAPAAPDADESKRRAIVAALEALR